MQTVILNNGVEIPSSASGSTKFHPSRPNRPSRRARGWLPPHRHCGRLGQRRGEPAGRGPRPVRSAISCAVRATGTCWNTSRYTASARGLGPYWVGAPIPAARRPPSPRRSRAGAGASDARRSPGAPVGCRAPGGAARPAVHLRRDRRRSPGSNPAATRQVLEHLVRIVDQSQGAARCTRLLARLAPRTTPRAARCPLRSIGRGRRGSCASCGPVGLQLRDPRRQLLDHLGLSGDEREQLLTRGIFQPGREATWSGLEDHMAGAETPTIDHRRLLNGYAPGPADSTPR